MKISWLLILTFGLLSQIARAQTGVLVERPFVWSKAGEFVPVEYSKAEPDGGFYNLELPNGSKKRVLATAVATVLRYPIPADFSEINDERGVKAIQTATDTFVAESAKFPTVVPLTTPKIALLKAEISAYQAGNRKYKGRWYNGVQYSQLTAELQKGKDDANQRQIALRRQADANLEQEQRILEEQQRIIRQQAEVEAARVAKERKARLVSYGDTPPLGDPKPAIRELLSYQLRDPDSLQIFTCTQHYLTEEGWSVVCDYGARNGYGGMNRHSVVFVVGKGGKVYQSSRKLPPLDPVTFEPMSKGY